MGCLILDTNAAFIIPWIIHGIIILGLSIDNLWILSKRCISHFQDRKTQLICEKNTKVLIILRLM